MTFNRQLVVGMPSRERQRRRVKERTFRMPSDFQMTGPNTDALRRRWRSPRSAVQLCLLVLCVLAGTATAHAQVAPAPETDTATAEDILPRTRSGIPTTPREVLREMKWYFVAPFLIASVLALWFTIERVVVLRRGRVIPKPFVERFVLHLREGKFDPNQALQLCDENGSPVAQVFAHGVRKWGKPSVEVEQAIIDGGERQVSQLRKHLRVINGVATVTPLIGLLGTVIGMIMAFNDIANSNAIGKAEELAGGIALALLTTAAGLMIAIPSLIAYTFLAGRVDSLVVEMDDLAQNVVRYISAEGLARRQAAASRARRPASSAAPAKPAEKEAV